ncbi:MAG: bifunctional 5,10-methylenetetrahydrofolate dehydrogenase/5,10-methenyltetrahydrofolate cyclohydrolase [Candidatus Nealsonbacteria bacterium]|nr:bifunctional 5,10-methylenetetrahydrofolate dehydrogenase/5,10-methenyltetrahydrofolate cyclohydrolase [Candidatus Nealsonbacteria bacterium]
MKIFNGKKEAEKILAQLKQKIGKNARPKLAVIGVKPDLASQLYIRNKKKAAKQIGIKVAYYELKNESDVIKKIQQLNANPSVHGIIVQLPLPKNFNVDRVIGFIDPSKDVDGFQQNSPLSPVLPTAILIALKKANRKIKKATALVNSKTLGETIKNFLTKEGIRVNYLLSESIAQLPPVDVLITVCGCPGIIKGDMIKEGAILIDAGISMVGGKILGDVGRESVAKKAAFLTPVPGGIGPLTVALLLKNVYSAYGNSKNHRPYKPSR